jgi:hypothetical protein
VLLWSVASRCFTTALLLLCWNGPVSGTAAQDHMARVKELYESAAFEEALAELETSGLAAGEEALAIEPAEYRILCLLALQRSERAQLEIERLILRYPMYRPDPSLVSPTVRTTFEAVRRRLLPGIVENHYVAAMRSLDEKHYSAALLRFDLVLSLLDDGGDDPRLSKLRSSASGFRDLASAAASQADATLPSKRSGPPALSAASVLDTIYGSRAREVLPPIPAKQTLPPVPRDRSLSTATSGLFEIVIDESGRVESAIVRRSIDPQYDALLLQEARTWRYQPARRYGTAVKFRKLIEVYSAP